MKTTLISSLIVVLAAACGGNKPAPTKPVEAKMEKQEMAPELTKFHDILAPRWHADKGDKRMADTCGAMAEFQTKADELTKATPPATADASKWTTGTKELLDAVTALDASCKAKDATAFEPAFEHVHNSFHGLLESTGGEHNEAGEHKEGGETEHKM
ncbi:MAG: hypothetical protein H6Q90_202 [Deltaproteobacteria bacterium]|nr:hypothetical protein [Deltaproteobacteria bacterium]